MASSLNAPDQAREDARPWRKDGDQQGHASVMWWYAAADDFRTTGDGLRRPRC
jgi:hypothetical protein